MKTVLLIGLGRFGRHIAQKLYTMHRQVMAVDKDEERVNEVLPYVTGAQIGDSTNRAFLETLGVQDFDLCIVAIGDNFQSSLETTSLVKELGASLVVARASTDIHEKFLLRNGADDVVYPERDLAARTAVRYSLEHIVDYLELGDEYAVYELEVPRAWQGRSVGELEIRKKYGMNIMGIRRNGRLDLNITPHTQFEEGATVLVLGKREEVRKYFRI